MFLYKYKYKGGSIFIAILRMGAVVSQTVPASES